MQFWPKTLALVLALCALVIAPSVSAQSSKNTAIYTRSGEWTIFEHPRSQYCRLVLGDDIKQGLMMSKGGREVGMLRYIAPNKTTGRATYPVRWSFDGQVFPGELIIGTNFLAMMNDPKVIEAFRKSDQLKLSVAGLDVFKTSLKGSSAAYRKLEQCAGRWPDSVVPVQPPPPPAFIPPRPREPVLSGQLPANRDVAPIQSQRWITAENLPDCFYKEECKGGDIGVTLLVNKRGRVTECTLKESAADEVLNTAVCNLLKDRARFDPATNDAAQAVSSFYSFKLSLVMPPEDDPIDSRTSISRKSKARAPENPPAIPESAIRTVPAPFDGTLAAAIDRETWIKPEDLVCEPYDCQSGEVGVRVLVGKGGRAAGCTITRSSGIAAMDKHACDLMIRRARFEPARSRDGKPLMSSWTTKLTFGPPPAQDDDASE